MQTGEKCSILSINKWSVLTSTHFLETATQKESKAIHPNEHCNCRYADVGCDKMEEVMDQISGKWKMCILFMVGAHGTLRYGELRKLLDGVTHKMLSNQLKELAADGLVERIDYNEMPPRVEYRLTPNGEALMPIFDDIQAYIRKGTCHTCCEGSAHHACCE